MDSYAGAKYSFTSDNPDVLEVKGPMFNGGSYLGYLVPHSYGDATVSMYLGGRLCDTMTVHVVKPGENCKNDGFHCGWLLNIYGQEHDSAVEGKGFP